jgi:hypothetical protein
MEDEYIFPETARSPPRSWPAARSALAVTAIQDSATTGPVDRFRRDASARCAAPAITGAEAWVLTATRSENGKLADLIVLDQNPG